MEVLGEEIKRLMLRNTTLEADIKGWKWAAKISWILFALHTAAIYL